MFCGQLLIRNYLAKEVKINKIMAKKAKKKDKAKKENAATNERQPKLKRTHKVVVSFNDNENEVFETYCKKYKVNKKTRFIRETIIRTIMERFLEDYPTLFEKPELDKLVVKQNI